MANMGLQPFLKFFHSLFGIIENESDVIFIFVFELKTGEVLKILVILC